MSRLLAALLLVALAAPAFALPPKSHVVVIGNNFGDPTEVGLRYAQRDAQSVAEALRRLGDVPSERITTLLDADAATVEATLQALGPTLADAPVLVVY